MGVGGSKGDLTLAMRAKVGTNACDRRHHGVKRAAAAITDELELYKNQRKEMFSNEFGDGWEGGEKDKFDYDWRLYGLCDPRAPRRSAYPSYPSPLIRLPAALPSLFRSCSRRRMWKS